MYFLYNHSVESAYQLPISNIVSTSNGLKKIKLKKKNHYFYIKLNLISKDRLHKKNLLHCHKLKFKVINTIWLKFIVCLLLNFVHTWEHNNKRLTLRSHQAKMLEKACFLTLWIRITNGCNKEYLRGGWLGLGRMLY